MVTRLARGRMQCRRAREGKDFEAGVLAGSRLCLQTVTRYLLKNLWQLVIESNKEAISRSLVTTGPGEKDTGVVWKSAGLCGVFAHWLDMLDLERSQLLAVTEHLPRCIRPGIHYQRLLRCLGKIDPTLGSLKLVSVLTVWCLRKKTEGSPKHKILTFLFPLKGRSFRGERRICAAKLAENVKEMGRGFLDVFGDSRIMSLLLLKATGKKGFC